MTTTIPIGLQHALDTYSEILDITTRAEEIPPSHQGRECIAEKRNNPALKINHGAERDITIAHAIAIADIGWANDLTIESAYLARVCIDEARALVVGIETRDGWRGLGNNHAREREYRLVLSAGVPGLRICGWLGADGEPETAELQWADSANGWTPAHLSPGGTDIRSAVLLQFARMFKL